MTERTKGQSMSRESPHVIRGRHVHGTVAKTPEISQGRREKTKLGAGTHRRALLDVSPGAPACA
jgi:hypothetical protein